MITNITTNRLRRLCQSKAVISRSNYLKGPSIGAICSDGYTNPFQGYKRSQDSEPITGYRFYLSFCGSSSTFKEMNDG